MFSEKVKVIPTEHNLNFLTVENFQEVFFDVFEITINTNTFIAEKVSEYKGMPVVIVPITHLNKKYDASFVLKKGAFEVLFNPANSTYTSDVQEEDISVEEELQDIIEYKDTSIDEFINEKRDNIINDINQAKISATKYAEAIKQQKISEASLDIQARQVRLKNEIAELKQGLLNEFYSLTETVRSDLHESNTTERNNVLDFINNSLNKLSDKLISDVKLQRTDAIALFNEKIEQLANNILKVNLLKEIEHNQVSNLKTIDEKFKAVTAGLNTFILEEKNQIVDTVTNLVNTKLEEYDTTLITLEKVNVEINESVKDLNRIFTDSINSIDTKFTDKLIESNSTLDNLITNKFKEYDKSLNLFEKAGDEINDTLIYLKDTITDNTASINNIDTKLNESNSTLDNLISTRIEIATTNIHGFYDNKIQLIEANVTDITAAQKQEFINLINESKQSLLAQIAEIKIEPSQILIEQKGGTPIDLKDIKKDLEKEITNRFTNELINLKRYIELSSGGGSVAKQFANGGTMNGNLIIVGTLSASQYLGITGGGGGVSGDYLPLSGGTLTGGLTANNVIVLGSLSASQYLGLSIPSGNYLPLSGGTLTGSLTANSNVTILGTIRATQTLNLENGTTSNSMYVYNTYTSSTTYERAYLNWVSNTLQIGTDKGSGGGVARSINLQTDGTTRMSIAATSGDVNVVGNFSAATKSFLIPHPTKIDKQLQYGCLEGPENGVYVRGKTNESIIYLPEYWKALVDEESVTVTLTSINKYQQLYVESQDSTMVKIGNVTGFYNYVIFGERKDVNKLQTEI